MKIYLSIILGGVLLASSGSADAKKKHKAPKKPAAAAPAAPAALTPSPAPPPPAEKPTVQERTIKVEATTAHSIGLWTVTVPNVTRNGKWKGEDGTEHEGAAAEVGVFNEKDQERSRRTVGSGAVLTINGEKWHVAKVHPGAEGEKGHIELSGPVAK